MEHGASRTDATASALAPCKINMLIKAADLAARDVQHIDAWHIRIARDTHAIRSVGLALSKRLPSADIRAHIAKYVCRSDLRELHRRLCYLKTQAYHVLSKKPLWHCVSDADAEGDPCHQMIRVYAHSIRGLHRPKLFHLRHSLKMHRRVNQKAFCYKRVEWATKSLETCESTCSVAISNDHPLSSMLKRMP